MRRRTRDARTPPAPSPTPAAAAAAAVAAPPLAAGPAMRMDSSLGNPSSGSTASAGSSARSSGGVGNGPASAAMMGARAGDSSSARLREAAHFANIMVEFENGNREMAVDVPDSFVAHAKTPPKFPPPHRANGTLPSSVGSGSGRNNGHHQHHRHGSLNSSTASSPPPALNSRDHLRIERDGHLRNDRQGPSPPDRGSSGRGSGLRANGGSGSGFMQPTEQQSLRIKKYSEEIMRRNMESERRERGEEFLRQSLRNSQRLRALKERNREQHPSSSPGVANSAFDTIADEEQQQRPSIPDLASVLQAMKRLEVAGVLVGEGAEAVKAVIKDGEFQNSLTLNQKVLLLHFLFF